MPLDVAMCELCNPLGLKQPATSQVHGTVFLALLLAIVVLAVAGRAALSGIGPFTARIATVSVGPSGLVVTLEVRNDGSKAGTTSCRLTRAETRGVGVSELVLTPHIEPGQSRRFTTTTGRFGTQPVYLAVDCQPR